MAVMCLASGLDTRTGINMCQMKLQASDMHAVPHVRAVQYKQCAPIWENTLTKGLGGP
jgi:hypothetical protein